MTASMQCENCGAVLLPEDVFCGECGAPRPSQAEVDESTTEEPSVSQLPDEPLVAEAMLEALAQPSSSSETRWRVAAVVLVVLGALACIAGIAAFLLFGLTPSETSTPQEDWLFSTICCLLPIGGSGVLLAAIAGIIWYTRLRER
jgi:hypothetical protein